MFTIPGLSCLLVFMYIRPQEHYIILQKLPLLYMFFAAAVGGLVVDLKLRLLKPLPARSLILATCFWTWVIIVIALKVPAAEKLGGIIRFTIVFMLYIVVSQGVQSFRGLRVIAGTLVFISMFLTVVGIHQGLAPNGCLLVTDHFAGTGIADGRPCDSVVQCLGVDAEPGVIYDCQRIGLFGTVALDDRVRYRGELQDPNELSVVICAGMSLIFAFAASKKGFRYKVLAAIAVGMVGYCIILTQSRGGMLVFIAVLGVYYVKKYGPKYLIFGAVAVMPLMTLGGRSGAAADESTAGRYEAWRSGLGMLQSDPVFGVGHDMFTKIHILTAHNSYVLVMAETGLIGMFLWLCVMYVTVKVPLTAVLHFQHDPRAGPAVTWGMGILGMATVYLIQMLFLSLTYHTITWVLFGLSGAFYQAVKHHAPEWEVKFGLTDAAIVAAMCIGFVMVLPVFLTLKGF